MSSPPSMQAARGELLHHYLRHPLEFVRFLKLQRVSGFNAPREPHLDDAATQLFTELLAECTAYLEFGSGGSTVLADKLNKKTLTVESDRYYANVVRNSLRKPSQVEIMDINIGLTGPWSYPIFDWPTARRIRRWSLYVRKPFEVLESQGWFPDLVLLDGRFRRACALETARIALEGGRTLKLMFDDYYSVDRAHYHEVERWLGKPQCAGRAALFDIDGARSDIPSKEDVANAVMDYR